MLFRARFGQPVTAKTKHGAAAMHIAVAGLSEVFVAMNPVKGAFPVGAKGRFLAGAGILQAKDARVAIGDSGAKLPVRAACNFRGGGGALEGGAAIIGLVVAVLVLLIPLITGRTDEGFPVAAIIDFAARKGGAALQGNQFARALLYTDSDGSQIKRAAAARNNERGQEGRRYGSKKARGHEGNSM